MCMRDKVDAAFGDMSFAAFKRLIDQVPDLARLHLQGNGEPLLHRELPAFIRYARDRGIQVSIISNGTVMSEELAAALVASGLNEIQFSIDSLDPDAYALIRVGARLDSVLNNIRSFLRVRGPSPASPAASLATVVQRSNQDRLSGFIDLAVDLGLGKVSLQSLETKHTDRYADGFLGDHAPSCERGELLERLIAAKAEAVAKGIEFDFVPARTRLCRWPWEGMYITWDGQVTPCCLIFDHVIGDASQQDLMEIWNGPAMREFRSQLRGQRPPEQCRGCSHCGQWKI